MNSLYEQDKRIKKGLTDLQGYESNNLNLA